MSRSGTSLPNSLLLPNGALDVMEETYSSSFFETEPLYQFHDQSSDSPDNGQVALTLLKTFTFHALEWILQLKWQDLCNELPSIEETSAELNHDCGSEEVNLPVDPKMRDLGELKKVKALTRSNSKEVKALATILSQSTLWHDLPVVRESGILG